MIIYSNNFLCVRSLLFLAFVEGAYARLACARLQLDFLLLLWVVICVIFFSFARAVVGRRLRSWLQDDFLLLNQLSLLSAQFFCVLEVLHIIWRAVPHTEEQPQEHEECVEEFRIVRHESNDVRHGEEATMIEHEDEWRPFGTGLFKDLRWPFDVVLEFFV